MVLEMQQWDSDIVYRKGALHHEPDTLSRLYENEPAVIAALEAITDSWYAGKVNKINESPTKFSKWKAEE